MCAGGNIWRIWGRGGKRSQVDRTVGRLKGSKRSTEQRVPAAAPVSFGDQSGFLSKPTSGILMIRRSESTHGRRVCLQERKGGVQGVGGVRASLPALGTAQPGRAVACRSGEQEARCALEAEPQRRQGGGIQNGPCDLVRTSAALSLESHTSVIRWGGGAFFSLKLEC